MLDADLAALYGVTTKALNQAVKRNANRFPGDFAFQLAVDEADILRSQSVTSRSQVNVLKGQLENRSQIVTGSMKHRDPAIRPWVFTEHGALMAANVLRSQQDAALRDIYRKLLPLLQPPPDPPRRPIGFHTSDK
jgi:hypothetical protein